MLGKTGEPERQELSRQAKRARKPRVYWKARSIRLSRKARKSRKAKGIRLSRKAGNLGKLRASGI